MRRRLALLVLLAFLAGGAAGAVADGDRREGKGAQRDRDGNEDGGRGDGEGDADHGEGRGKDRDGDDQATDHDGDGDKGGGGKERGRGDDRARGDKARPGGQRAEIPQVDVALTGDAAVRQSARTEPGRLTYLLLVGGLGPAVADDVSLRADLPDLGGEWTLAGAASKACRTAGIEGLHLHCSFGDMAPGDLRLLEASSAVHLPPAWEVKTTTVLAAGNDGRPGNDSATSVVGILLT